MKKNILFKVVTFIIASCLISCANDDTNIQKNNKSVKTKAYSSQVEEAKALALPVDKINNIPKSIKDKRAAAVILSNYVSIKDSLYSIDISKEDAQKLGVDADLYTSILQDLELSNKIIKEARQKGEKLVLPDIKEEAKKYRISNQIPQVITRFGDNGKNQYGAIGTMGNEEGMDTFLPKIWHAPRPSKVDGKHSTVLLLLDKVLLMPANIWVIRLFEKKKSLVYDNTSGFSV